MTGDSPCLTCDTLADCRTCLPRRHWLARGCLTCEDVRWLLDAGEIPENVARRLGLTPDSLATHLKRHGRADLRARTLVRAS